MSSQHAMLTKLNILLVEDNQFNRELARIILEKAGHRVTPAVNGLDTLEQLAGPLLMSF